MIQQNNRAVGYVRRSTDRQEQSIPDQKKAIEAYAAETGFKLSKFYVDDAISGTSTIGRRSFLQMLEDAESNTRNFEFILVYDVKRFGRVDNDEAGYYRHKLRMHGVEIRYVTENFSGDTTDDLLRPVKQWQARQESKDLSKVTIRGLLSKVDGGWWMGGTPPYGYDLRYENANSQFLFIVRFMPDGTKHLLDENGLLTRTLARGESINISKRDRAKLLPSSPDRVEVITRIFHMYAEQGRGYKSLAEILNTEGHPTPRGPQWAHIYSGYWTDTTIRAILVNPLYAGDMVWNRRTDAKFHKISEGRAVNREMAHGARLVPNDETDWIIIRDSHPALVNRRLFEQAKQRRENNPASIEQRGCNPRLKTHGKTWNGQRSRFILSGLMTCALCGNRYQGVTRARGSKKLDGSRNKSTYYGCAGHITKGNVICQLNAILQKDLENIVIDAVLKFYQPYLAHNGRTKLAEAVKNQIGSEDQNVDQARMRAQAEHEQIGQTIANLLDNITPTNREYVDKRLKELTDHRQQLASRLEELERISLSQAQIDTIVTDAINFISGLEQTLREGLPQEKLLALRQCITRILISKPENSVRILFRLVPAGNLENTQECLCTIAAAVNH